MFPPLGEMGPLPSGMVGARGALLALCREAAGFTWSCNEELHKQGGSGRKQGSSQVKKQQKLLALLPAGAAEYSVLSGADCAWAGICCSMSLAYFLCCTGRDVPVPLLVGARPLPQASGG